MKTRYIIAFWVFFPCLMLLFGLMKAGGADSIAKNFAIIVLEKIPVISILLSLSLWTIAILKYRRFLRKKLNEYFHIRIPLLKYRIIHAFFRKDTILLLDSIYDPNVECVDSYSLFLYFQEVGIKSKYVLWRSNPLYDKLLFGKNFKDIIVLDQINPQLLFFQRTFSTLLRTKIIITSFGGLHPILIDYFYSKKDILHVHIGHGKTFLKTSVFLSDYLSAAKYNKFVVASDLEKKIFMGYGWAENDLIQVGLPRWDLLGSPHASTLDAVIKTREKKLIFVMFTWRTSFKRKNIKKYKMPIASSQYVGKIASLISSEKLGNLLEENGIEMALALHHSLYKQVADFPVIAGVNIVNSNEVSSFVRNAEMLITDYSSVAFDFLFLNKPVLFYRLDYRDTNLLDLDRYDAENAKEKDNVIFNVVYDEDSVIALIDRYIKSDFKLEEEYIEKSLRFFTTRSKIREKISCALEEHYLNYIDASP